jgi:hypothetical protein
MEKIRAFTRDNARIIAASLLIVLVLGFLLLNRLGSLAGGLSSTEVQAATMAVGWHGIYHQPLYLLVKLLRSIFFAFSPSHGKGLTRLPNVILGALTIVIFSTLIWLWHGRRTAVMTSILFACSAWVLHVSRLASFDVLYLLTLPTLLLVNRALYTFNESRYVWYISLVALVLTLYVPGMIWLLILAIYFLQEQLIDGWKRFSSVYEKVATVAILLLPSLFLLFDLTRSVQLKLWLGLPKHMGSVLTILKHFIAVPIHLFIRGPQYPDLWLGRTPILDVFTLLMCLIGIYFYATHLKAARSRMLGGMLIIGWILVALGGPVSLSLLVPLMYVFAAMGMTYFLREWLKVFPLNPIARLTGIGLISLLICFAAIYNLRAYFVAWPHNQATRATFVYKP